MSEFRRRLMMQQESDPNTLPAGCVRCEYIESYYASNNASAQYIDTERKMNSTDIFGFTFTPCAGNSSQSSFGWKITGTQSSGEHSLLYLFDTYFYFAHGIYWANTTKFDFTPNETKFEVVVNQVLKSVTINDATIRCNFDKPYSNGNSVYDVMLFTSNNIGSITRGGRLRMHDFWVKDKYGNMIQHLVPILDVNGVPCMYDTVKKKYHYNKRTGNFNYKILEQ